MQIGVGLPNQVRNVDPMIIPAWASRAEAAGFSSLATVGRIAYPGVMDTVALSAAAAVTETIGLTSTVMLSTVWPSVLLAKELAGIAGISGGRLTLGLGIGGDRADDFVVESLPPRGLGRRMDQDIESYESIWRGAPVGGGHSPAVPSGAQPIPLLFGGASQAAMMRMARCGEGYIGGSLPAPMVQPMFESARQAWSTAGREGSPRIVAISYFALSDREEARGNVHDYYRVTGDEIAGLITSAIRTDVEALRAAAHTYADMGVDELIFHPALGDIDEVDRLADVVL
jgi:alkanesulfonate monooxygenase SsuD/methylene tetrahydromethanopterin reductase-like flavin-dependent oxidoreductase (luciferase family)